MDSRKIGTIGSRFEAIICGFCLPYLSKNDGIKLIKNLLTEKGILYISFIEGDYKKSNFQIGDSGNRVFFYYHELEDLVSELSESNFQILHTINVEYKGERQNEIHTIVIAKSNK